MRKRKKAPRDVRFTISLTEAENQALEAFTAGGSKSIAVGKLIRRGLGLEPKPERGSAVSPAGAVSQPVEPGQALKLQARLVSKDGVRWVIERVEGLQTNLPTNFDVDKWLLTPEHYLQGHFTFEPSTEGLEKYANLRLVINDDLPGTYCPRCSVSGPFGRPLKFLRFLKGGKVLVHCSQCSFQDEAPADEVLEGCLEAQKAKEEAKEIHRREAEALQQLAALSSAPA